MLCGSDKNVGILLEVTANLPTASELERWLGEPIRGILLPTSIFLTNKKGYPVLSQAHQIFLRKCSSICNRIILTGCNRHRSLKNYVKYINYIFEVIWIFHFSYFKWYRFLTMFVLDWSSIILSYLFTSLIRKIKRIFYFDFNALE